MIPYLSLDDILTPEILREIYYSKQFDYYWSDDFSLQFFIELAKRGFITIAICDDNQEFLLPEMQKEYALLEHKHLHISKTVKPLIKQKRYQLSINTHLDEIVQGIKDAYDDCWIHDSYHTLLKELSKERVKGFELLSSALIDTHTGKLVAGEIGYIVHSHYVGLTKFSLKSDVYKNIGTLQRILLTNYLSFDRGIYLSNLGQPQMTYKLALGAKIYSRNAFLRKCGFFALLRN